MKRTLPLLLMLWLTASADGAPLRSIGTGQWEGMAEYGFNFDDVKVFLAGATYRF